MENNIKFIQTTNEKNVDKLDYGTEIEFSSFVGIRYGVDKKLRIHYPRALFSKTPNIDNSIDKKIIKELINSIKLADSKSKKEDDVTSNHFEKIDSFPYYSYNWICDDFKSNGRLLSFDIIHSKNSNGKINLKRTLCQDSYIYNDSVVITDFIYNSKRRNENLLTEIYDYCLYRSIEVLFFLANLSSRIIHPIHKTLNRGLITLYRQALLEELSQTFDDEKKLRYNHMLSIICSEKNIETINGIIYGVDKYNCIFEKMIDQMFGSKNIDKKSYYPSAKLISTNEEENLDEESDNMSKLRPDTINNENNVLLIIDSKFYEFGNKPQTSDVAKQIVYGQYAEKENKANSIYNIFLMPKYLGEKKYEYIGYSKTNWMSNDKTYHYVLFYYIDLKYILLNYRKGYDEFLLNIIKNDVINKFPNDCIRGGLNYGNDI